MLHNRIMVVDDDPMNLEIVKEILGEYCSLKLVDSGEKALDELASFRPDVVLLDVMMPGVDGYQVCKRIKEDPELRFTKILMVSAKAIISDRLNGYQLGADDYITKPFNDEELLAKVKVFLKLKFLEELEQLRKNTLKSISKNIKEPLINIFGESFVSDSAEGSDIDNIRYHLKHIQEEGKKFIEYCNKAMLLCELKDSRDLNFERVNIEELIERVVLEIEGAAKDKKIEILYKNELGRLVTIDAKLIENAVGMILQNSIRYSSMRSTIQVNSLMDGDQCLIVVEDAGETLMRRLFNELSRDDADPDLAGEGVGINMAEIIAKMHDGKLIYKKGRQTGVRFEFRIPFN